MIVSQAQAFLKAQAQLQKMCGFVEHAPLDERLGLPASDSSYVLGDWLQRLCVKESFARR